MKNFGIIGSFYFVGIFSLKEESNKVCSKRFMVCYKDSWGYRGNYYRCPVGFAFEV